MTPIKVENKKVTSKDKMAKDDTPGKINEKKERHTSPKKLTSAIVI